MNFNLAKPGVTTLERKRAVYILKECLKTEDPEVFVLGLNLLMKAHGTSKGFDLKRCLKQLGLLVRID